MKKKYIDLNVNNNYLYCAMNFMPVFALIVGLIYDGIFNPTIGFASEQPLTIEAIHCHGNVRSSCNFIQSQTLLREGDEVNDEEVNDSIARLKLIGFFEDVTMSLEKGSAQGRVILNISVTEVSSYGATASIGIVRPWKSFYGIADVTGFDRNISGRGDTLSLRVRTNYQDQNIKGGWHDYKRVEKTFLARAEYVLPQIASTKLFLVTGLGYGHSVTGWNGPQTSYQNLYDDTNAWADVALGYRLFKYSYVSLGARSFLNGTKFSPVIQYGWDSQDDPYFPTKGSKLQIGLFLDNGFPEHRSKSWNLAGSFLKHWQLVDSHILSLQLGGFNSKDPAFAMREDWAASLRYSNHFRRNAAAATIKNGSFYLEPGLFATAGSHEIRHAVGAKLGVTLQTSMCLFNFFTILSGI